MILVYADSEEEAVSMAIAPFKNKTATYETSDGQSVSWILDSVINIYSLPEDTISSGIEVFGDAVYKRKSS